MEPFRINSYEANGRDWIVIIAENDLGQTTMTYPITPELKAQIRTLVAGWDTDEMAEALRGSADDGTWEG